MKLRLILENIRSTYNVGSIFRSADAFGVEKIYLLGYTPSADREEISKTALGAETTVDWEAVSSIAELTKGLKAEGFTIAALELNQQAIDLKKYSGTQKLALILGNETEGVSAEAIAESDIVIQIPMRGTKESLNVAVTAAIAMYELAGK